MPVSNGPGEVLKPNGRITWPSGSFLSGRHNRIAVRVDRLLAPSVYSPMQGDFNDVRKSKPVKHFRAGVDRHIISVAV